MRSLSLLLLFTLIPGEHALNILLFASGHAKSHTMLSYRMASALVAQGHHVVVHTGPTFGDDSNGVEPPQGIREIRQAMPRQNPMQEETAAEHQRAFQDMIWKPRANASLFDSFKLLARYNSVNKLAARSCFDEPQLATLRKERFDIALAHYRSLCPLGIARILGVEKFVWVSTAAYNTDFGASVLRIPTIPSYIPNANSKFTDRMGFVERGINWGFSAFLTAFDNMPGLYMNEEDAQFRSVVNQNRTSMCVAPGVPRGQSLREIAADSVATMFINGEQALDCPRPLLPGMTFLGQLDKRGAAGRNLYVEWLSALTNGRDGAIIFSLGTLANTSSMPMEMKVTFLEAFKHFPTYSIIWRLEGRMPPRIEAQRHITVVNWLPQRDILQSGSVKLFITHAGYNGLVESGQAGVPVLMIPLFGDHFANAKRALQLGLGLSLDRTELYNGTIIREAMETILGDPKFPHRTSKLSRLMMDKPFTNEDVWIKRVEAIAKCRRWPISAARRMPTFQLLCLDVISAIVLFVFGVIFCV